MRLSTRLRQVLTVGAISTLTVLAGASSALALGTPRWQITTFATPHAFVPYEGGEARTYTS